MAVYSRRLNLDEYVVVGERAAPDDAGLADGATVPVLERRDIVGDVRVCIPLYDTPRCYPDPPVEVLCAAARIE
jgi:hypothetical protein